MKDKIKKDNVQTYIQFYLDEVELNISVKDDLSGHKENDPLRNFGHFQVSTGHKDNEDCFWDNISFFISAGKKEFKEECKKELQQKGFKDWKETYKKVKTLLKRAKKLNLIS